MPERFFGRGSTKFFLGPFARVGSKFFYWAKPLIWDNFSKFALEFVDNSGKNNEKISEKCKILSTTSIYSPWRKIRIITCMDHNVENFKKLSEDFYKFSKLWWKFSRLYKKQESKQNYRLRWGLWAKPRTLWSFTDFYISFLLHPLVFSCKCKFMANSGNC